MSRSPLLGPGAGQDLMTVSVEVIEEVRHVQTRSDPADGGVFQSDC
jgi:hypothetical protein